MRPPRRRRGRAPSASTDHAAREDCQNRVADEVEGSVSPTSRGARRRSRACAATRVACAADAFATGTIGDDPRHTGISDATRSASANAATPFHRPLRSTRSLRSAWSSRSASRSVPITHACSRPAKLSVTKRARRGSRPAAPKPLGSTAAGSGVRTSCEHRRVGYFCPDFHSRRLYIVTATAGRQCNRYLFREEVNN